MNILRPFRNFFRTPFGRALTASLVAATAWSFSDPSTFLYALEQQRAKEAEVREIARKLNVDPEFLLHPEGRTKFDFAALFAWVGKHLRMASAAQPSQQPLNVQDSIARVKSRYALVAADAALGKVAALAKLPAATSAAKKGQIRAELQSLLRMLDRNVLPQLPNGLPAVAATRDRDMRNAIDQLRQQVHSAINGPNALDDTNLDTTLGKLRTAIGGTMTIPQPKPRWTKDPFPLKDAYTKAPVKPPLPAFGSTSISSTPSAIASTSTAAPKLKRASNAVPSDVAALAGSLGTPAKAFTWVHDHIGWESYSGVAKGSHGALAEGSANDWDQALLLRDLLTAQGYQAQIEWGKVTIPIARVMNLVGTEDPLQAANLLATAGFDGTVITTGSVPVAVQMTHAWVQAFIPFLPNRGATNGTADTWVRMDPSFKRYTYQAGLAVSAPWNEDEYLQTSAVRAPTDFYADKVWSYIRTNNLTCQNLGQVPKSGQIRAENFPFVPSTLTAHIDSVSGLAADAPSDQNQRVTLTVADASGATLATYVANVADVWGKKLTLTFPPATPDDAAIIASYGGLFNTPAYLVHLMPVISIDDTSVVQGTAVAAGAALDLNVLFQQPNVSDDTAHHDVTAGETHTIVLDPGNVPDALLTARADRLKTLTADDPIVSEKLYVTGLRYMQHVDDGTRFAAGVRWQRSVKRLFEADVRRQINIAYNVAGAPLRLTAAENNIDVARLAVGIVPIGSDLTQRASVLSLAGMESSYREGQIWEETESVQGISAAKALLLARMAGQTIQTVDASNVDTVLAATTLSDDVQTEIRGAVAQGRIAKLAPTPIALGHWSGTGYILEDPVSGAATYPISGGIAGGSDTGDLIAGIQELLGSEAWLSDSPLGDLLRQLLALLGGGSNNGNTPSTTQSDPVNLSSGNMFRTATDVSVVARGIPVALMRTYNSRSTYDGPFGYGWTFNYGAMLIPNGDGSVTYREDDGTEHHFANQGGTLLSPPGKHITLTASGNGWTMQFKDGTQFTFNAAGLLASQSDLNGNTVTLNRDASGNLTNVVDAGGRTVLTFTYTGSKITQVADLGGRTVVYGYTGEDLTSVVDTAGKTWTMAYDLGHNMVAFTDPLGHTQTYDYDADDRLMHHVDATGAEEFFQYDIANRQSVLTDRRGGDRLVTYDDLGRATMEADPAGNVVAAAFDADNNRTQTTDSRGNTTSYEFDTSGNATKQTNPDGGIVTTTYDTHSRPLTSTDAGGLTTNNVYDANGNLLTSSRSVGGVTQTTTNTYDSNGQLLTSADPVGGTTSMTWNGNGTLATRTDAAGNTTTMMTDPLGRIRTIQDPAGNATSLTYDGKDRMLTMTDPYSNTTTFAYDDAGRRSSVTTPRGTTTYTYDAEGRVLSVKDPLGNTTSTTYDAAGDVLTRTDARGNTTRYAYDTIGRVTQMTDAAGGVWTYGYCASLGGGGGASCSSCGGGGGGSFCQLTDADGNTLNQQFDLMGRVASVTDALGHSSFTQYDLAGRKTLETDALGNATKYGYDEAGRLVSVTEASGAVTSYTYDANGNKLTQKDANGHTWSYQYDALNRLVKETDPLNRSTSFTYDPLGNLKTKTDAKGQTLTYAYTVRRLTSITYPNGAADTFTYDALGRRTGMSNASVSFTYAYDNLNRVTAVTNTTYNLSAQYQYDAAGNRTKMTTPLAVTSWAYDAKNRMASITDSLMGTFRFAYDAMDRRTTLAYPNGQTTSYAYDSAYRITAIATKGPAGLVTDAWSYQYDAVGNRTSKMDMNGALDSYTYDNVYRLTQASYGDGARESFTYDAVGNRLSANAGALTAYRYDAANQMLSAGNDTFTYDANGNETAKTTPNGTTTLTYDVNNRLTALTGPDGNETSVYAPDGMRVRVNGPASSGDSPVLSDLQGNPVEDFGGNRTHRVYGPGVDEVLAEDGHLNSVLPFLRYLHHDALGSVTAATAPDGSLAWRRTYRAFGQMTTTPPSGDPQYSRLGFTGREISAGSLMEYRSRYYDTAYGRFAQQDTYRGDELTPPSLHRYDYALNNPIRYVDPAGTLAEELLAAGLIAVAAASIGWLVHCWENIGLNMTTAGCVLQLGSFFATRAWPVLFALFGFITSVFDFFCMGIAGDITASEFVFLFVIEALGAIFGLIAGLLIMSIESAALRIFWGMVIIGALEIIDASARYLAGLFKEVEDKKWGVWTSQ